MPEAANEEGTPFKCMECEQVVTSDTGTWPEECPHCGSSKWMTTMEAIEEQEPEVLEDEESPDGK